MAHELKDKLSTTPTSSKESRYISILTNMLEGTKPVSSEDALAIVSGIKRLYQNKELSQEFEKILAAKQSNAQLNDFLKKFIAYAFPSDTFEFEEAQNLIDNANFIHALTEGVAVDFKYAAPSSLWELVNIVYRYGNEVVEVKKAHMNMKNSELPPLTPREKEVLTYIGKGFTIKEIAQYMGIKWFTVNDHIKMLYKKLNVSSRAEAAVLASKNGLI